MAESTSIMLSQSLNSSLLSNNGDWQYQLEDLPNELIALIVGYLPLPDLANIRSVCSRLQRLVDDRSSRHLWANATLEGSCLWVTEKNEKLIQRAADHGNVEALIMLAVAYLYSEGVPEGSGKGTLDYYNGIKASKCLMQAEELTAGTPPFAWVLFRPPWARGNKCGKSCVCQRMQDHCSRNTTVPPTGIHYCIGKALSFSEYSTESKSHWYELGSEKGCLHSRLELWKSIHKPQLQRECFEPLRQLRALASSHHPSPSLLEARLELCSAYARGCYGGKSRGEALGWVREVMDRARPVLYESIYKLHKKISHNVRYILLDWVIEVAGMKRFSPHIVHLAINLIDRYLVSRPIPRTRLQLLGISCLLLAARWNNTDPILTVREAAWLTEETYDYNDVVRMMGGVIAAFKGEIKVEVITDYLSVLLDLAGADTPTRNLSHYLSECLLLHTKFGRYSASHLAASCLLQARVLLGTEFPWPRSLLEATGLTVGDLRRCCLALYDECLTDKNTITDCRKVKLESVTNRYASDMFGGISRQQFMSYTALKERLGVDPDTSLVLFTPTSKLCHHSDTLISFLSDSCNLSPGSEPFSPAQSDSDISMADEFEPGSLSTESNSPAPLELSVSEMEGSSFSPFHCSSKSLTSSPSGSGFPQPLFRDDDQLAFSGHSEPPHQRPVIPASQGASSHFMDTEEDTLFAQTQLTQATRVEMPHDALALTGPTPHYVTSFNGFSQGSDETPTGGVTGHHPLIADQPLTPNPLTSHEHIMTNSPKMFPTKDSLGHCERSPLKPVVNLLPPSSPDRKKNSGRENSVLQNDLLTYRGKAK